MICWQSLEKSCEFEEFRIVLSESPGGGMEMGHDAVWVGLSKPVSSAWVGVEKYLPSYSY